MEVYKKPLPIAKDYLSLYNKLWGPCWSLELYANVCYAGVLHSGYPIVAQLRLGQLGEDGELPGYDTKHLSARIWHTSFSHTHILTLYIIKTNIFSWLRILYNFKLTNFSCKLH